MGRAILGTWHIKRRCQRRGASQVTPQQRSFEGSKLTAGFFTYYGRTEGKMGSFPATYLRRTLFVPKLYYNMTTTRNVLSSSHAGARVS